MLGVPEEDEARFTDWAIRVLQIGPINPEVGRQATREVLDYFKEQVALRREGRQARTDDLVDYLLEAEMDGAPLTEKHILGTCFLLLIAGIDTTWSSIGAGLWHLGQHARGPPAPRRGPLPHPRRDRGVPAGLRPGDDGA